MLWFISLWNKTASPPPWSLWQRRPDICIVCIGDQISSAFACHCGRVRVWQCGWVLGTADVTPCVQNFPLQSPQKEEAPVLGCKAWVAAWVMACGLLTRLSQNCLKRGFSSKNTLIVVAPRSTVQLSWTLTAIYEKATIWNWQYCAQGSFGSWMRKI